MPLATPASDANGEFEPLFSMAGMGQVMFPPNQFPIPLQLPMSLAASTGTWTSGLMVADGYRIITVGILVSQAGTLVIQPYIDLAGTMARPAISTATVGGTLLIVDVPAAATATAPGNYMAPFATFTITINNTTASIASVTAFQVILSAG